MHQIQKTQKGLFGVFLKQKLIWVDNMGILPYLNLASFKTSKLTLLEKCI